MARLSINGPSQRSRNYYTPNWNHYFLKTLSNLSMSSWDVLSIPRPTSPTTYQWALFSHSTRSFGHQSSVAEFKKRLVSAFRINQTINLIEFNSSRSNRWIFMACRLIATWSIALRHQTKILTFTSGVTQRIISGIRWQQRNDNHV